MSATHTSLNQSQPGILRCTRCNTELPRHATFCGHCGERIEQNSGDSSSPKHADITTRYRITSLLRRQPPAQLFLALDTQQQRPVVILDIDISTLDESLRSKVIEAQQYQFDFLRRQRIPAIMPPVDLRFFNGHLSVVSGWPFAFNTNDPSQAVSKHPLTLHDLLQSGIGLPSEEIAIAWTYRLCRAIEQLHRQNILLGDLDPQAMLVSKQNYSGEPILSIFWSATPLRSLCSTPVPPSVHLSPFSAPETLQNEIEPCSDVYSLGSILYLLLTGITPEQAKQQVRQPLASPLDLNPRANSTLSNVVMQALALQREARFQSVSALSEALEQFLSNKKGVARSTEARKEQESMQTTIHNASIPVDNKSNIDNANLPLQEPDDATSSVSPLQAQLARRYLSRLKSNQSELHHLSAREASVEAGLDQKNIREGTAEEQMKNNISEQHASEQNRQHPSANQVLADIATTPKTPPADAGDTDDDTKQASIAQQAMLHETPPVTGSDQPDTTLSSEDEVAPVVETLEPTIRITAKDIKDTLEAAQFSSESTPVPPLASIDTADKKPQESTTGTSFILPEQLTDITHESAQQSLERAVDHAVSRFKKMFTGPLPALPRNLLPKEIQPGNAITHTQGARETDQSFFKRVQQFVLGEQVHTMSNAALIETPMRVQPNRSYSIRLNIVGRPAAKRVKNGGLSALSEGDPVHIEVRSALYQNYAYIVQQADVAIPASGYIAEITMPMQPLSSGPSGRRERLHIFFMDESREPLYEKPFVIELFISPRVHNGREGHNVLSIPL